MPAGPRPDAVDAAFGHCVAVTRDEPVAERAAIEAVRRGGRSRLTLLAQARYQAMARAEPSPAPADEPPGDVIDLAWQLSGTRPPAERAVVDLDARHHLGRASLGLALGLRPSTAAGLAASYAEAWERDLGPALLASLGPAGCDELAALLPPEATARQLLDVAPAVASHSEACEGCADRRRSMTSVRTLIGQVPFGAAPPPVRQAARSSRRVFASLPPSIHASRRPGWVVVALGAAVALLVAAAIAAVQVRGDGGSERTAGGVPTALAVAPRVVDVREGVVDLRNRSSQPVTWRAVLSVPWLDAEPAAGRIPAGGRATLRLRVLPIAPDGDVRAILTVTTGASTVAAAVRGVIDVPPDVAATIEGCAVSATAHDGGEVREVALGWHAPDGEHAVPMAATRTGWAASIPSDATIWWVRAVDERGNGTSTAAMAVEPGTCQPRSFAS